MRCSRLGLGLFAFLFFIFSGAKQLRAWDDWLPITPEDRNITAASEKGVDAIILYHEETSDDNTRHRYVYIREKVLTEKGKSQADVVIPYDAANIGISEIKARTVAPDGTVTPFAGKAFDTTVIKGHGIKFHAKTFTLANVQVGSIIEWKYTEYWDEFLRSPHWAVQEELPQKHAKFTFIPITLTGMGEYIADARGNVDDRVFYTLVGLPESTKIKQLPTGRMELELHDVPAFQYEDFAPPESVLEWRVNFYYGTSKMLKPKDFWKEEGKYWSREVEGFIGHPDTSVLKEIVAPSDLPDQKLRKIYAYVQKIKNLSYEQGNDTLQQIVQADSKEKRSVATVLRKQEGYRDGITRAFIALARAAGIQAYAMRVAERDKVFFQVNLPNLLQLGSELAIAVVDGKEIFLDPGTPFCPYGSLPWRHTSTEGLRQVAGGGTEVASTPAASYKDAVSRRVGRLSLSPDGSAHGQVAIAWTGIEALEQRLNGFRTDDAGRKKELEDEMRSRLPQGATVKELKATGWDTPESLLSATFQVDIPTFASSTGKRLIVPSDLFQGDRTQPFAHGERKQPVYFNYPYYASDDVQITYPSGMKLENLPQDQPLQTEFSFYKVQRSAKGNTFSIKRDFAMGGIAFVQKDYPELKKFFSGVAKDDSEFVVLTAGK
ncbi:MAG TPA: DUF3857 domain-containing protein [Candidatus Angelobacter sp.]|nr:DUF3857 domain-containing protein [Candidatus Angelobacter sp.]